MQVSKSLYGKNNKNVFVKFESIIIMNRQFSQTCIPVRAHYFFSILLKNNFLGEGLYSGATIETQETIL